MSYIWDYSVPFPIKERIAGYVNLRPRLATSRPHELEVDFMNFSVEYVRPRSEGLQKIYLSPCTQETRQTILELT